MHAGTYVRKKNRTSMKKPQMLAIQLGDVGFPPVLSIFSEKKNRILYRSILKWYVTTDDYEVSPISKEKSINQIKSTIGGRYRYYFPVLQKIQSCSSALRVHNFNENLTINFTTQTSSLSMVDGAFKDNTFIQYRSDQTYGVPTL